MTIFLGALSTVFSLLYGLVFTFRAVSWARSAVKAIPVFALMLIALMSGAHWSLTVALALGVVGDLALSRVGERYFLTGLAAFLLGHVLYIWLFLGLGSAAFGAPSEVWRWGAMALVGFVAVGVYRALHVQFGALRLPVLAYIHVSVCLGLVALGQPEMDPYGWAILGVMLFIFSDVLLAFDLFGDGATAGQKRALAMGVWFNYWAGQSLIVIGVLVLV